MAWWVYVVRSPSTGKLYVGMTSRLACRLREHNNGSTRSTGSGVPWYLVHRERFEDCGSARARERFLKSGKGREYIKGLLSPSG